MLYNFLLEFQFRGGVLRTQKLGALGSVEDPELRNYLQKLGALDLLRTQSCRIISLLKLGADQNIAIRASSTAGCFFLVRISTFPVHSPSFFQHLSLLLAFD